MVDSGGKLIGRNHGFNAKSDVDGLWWTHEKQILALFVLVRIQAG
jgi:hypothetical protein